VAASEKVAKAQTPVLDQAGSKPSLSHELKRRRIPVVTRDFNKFCKSPTGFMKLPRHAKIVRTESFRKRVTIHAESRISNIRFLLSSLFSSKDGM
jgi:hypothetical protein